MAAPLLTLNSLLPSQSLFNEIQSIHETGFFHELDSFFVCKDGNSATTPTQVNSRKDKDVVFVWVTFTSGEPVARQ